MPAAPTLAIVGLGNFTHPLTRHSIGQLVLESLASAVSCHPGARGPAHLSLSRTKQAWTTSIEVESIAPSTSTSATTLLFIKPRALMNISGSSIIASIPSNFPPARILTIQDDLDLAPGVVKLQRGGSARGHNGVRSLEGALRAKDFWRLRVGIGRPESRSEVAKWVLSPMGRDDVRRCEWEEVNHKGKTVQLAWEQVQTILRALDEEP